MFGGQTIATKEGQMEQEEKPMKSDRLMYVNLKQEKFHFPDGRRGVRFFVIDSDGGNHLAVLGEERDTRYECVLTLIYLELI